MISYLYNQYSGIVEVTSEDVDGQRDGINIHYLRRYDRRIRRMKRTPTMIVAYWQRGILHGEYLVITNGKLTKRELYIRGVKKPFNLAKRTPTAITLLLLQYPDLKFVKPFDLASVGVDPSILLPLDATTICPPQQ